MNEKSTSSSSFTSSQGSNVHDTRCLVFLFGNPRRTHFLVVSSVLEERIQQVKDTIYRCDPLHVQISKLQTAIGRAESTVKNRREQLWQSPLAKSQDHLCELQRRLEDVMHQRKEEEDQGYDIMDLQDGCTSW